MSRDALAFVAGLGTGFFSQQEKKYDRERRKKLDDREQERHDADMQERRDKQTARQAMADAGAERTAVDGTAVQTDAGKTLYKDPAQASAAAEDARIEAEMRGQDPAKVQTMAAQGITGNMSKGHQITTKPVDVAALNTPEARAKRIAAAQLGLGDAAGAMQTEQGIRTGKLADMQLQQAEEAKNRDKAFREITDKFVRGGWGAVPKIYEGYNDGNTAQVKPDGKGGAIVTVLNDKGEKVAEQSYANELEFISTAIANVDPKLWVGMREKKAEAARTDAKEGRKQTEIERHNRAMEGIYGQRVAAAGRAGGAGAAGEQGAVEFDPLADFDSKKAFAIAGDQVSKLAEMRAAEGKPMTAAEQAAETEAIYQSLARERAAENTRKFRDGVAAKTLREAASDPEKYAVAYDKALRAGVSAETLNTMGFTKPAARKAEAGKQGAQSSQPAAAPGPAAARQPAAPIAATQGIQKPDQFAKMRADNIAQITPAVLELRRAEQELAAVARSGDPAAIRDYSAKVMALREQIGKVATAKFGDQAEQIVSKINLE